MRRQKDSRRLLSAMMIAIASFSARRSSYFDSKFLLVAAQGLETIIDIINEAMELTCYIPCNYDYSGTEVIPNTKCKSSILVLLDEINICVFFSSNFDRYNMFLCHCFRPVVPHM
jgi:hypothetical protein